MRAILVTFVALSTTLQLRAQNVPDRDIAARFAPVFHQALGDDLRGDYITNFDFDGDWRGDNNWQNAENKAFKLNGYIYYSVTETATHYFIHYAVFHARDYKGGEKKGVWLSKIIRQGARVSSKDPTGLLAEATMAHENDMEGALVVVEKAGDKVVFVETVHHNEFSRYVPENSERPGDGQFRLDGSRVELYIEPKGHGIEAFGTEHEKPEKGFLVYKFGGAAGDPEAAADGTVDYDLVPIATSLWPKRRKASSNLTFGTFKDFGTIAIDVVQGKGVVHKKVAVGMLATAFDGKIGGINMARPPWGWFSNDHRSDPPGLWFFDPAKIVKRDYALPDFFSTTYVKLPFWAGVSGKQ
jgi:hypothetical protein